MSLTRHSMPGRDDENTDFRDGDVSYNYFARLDSFTGTPDEIAAKQAKLREGFRRHMGLARLQRVFAEMAESHLHELGFPELQVTATDAELVANDTKDRMIALVKAKVQRKRENVRH